MLTRIQLTNFQCHSALDFPLSPGVSIIAAPTNKGKSAVFRALRWLVEHKPITGYEKHDTNNTQVSIETDKGTVTRFKKPGAYGYQVDDQTWVACGAQQPIPVKQTLGLDAINFQGQHDAPFLLALSPGQLARELNDIVDLSIIDKFTTNIKARITQNKGALEVFTARLKEQQAEYAAREWVEGAYRILDSLVKEDKKIDQAKERLQKLVGVTIDDSGLAGQETCLRSLEAKLEAFLGMLQDLDAKKQRYVRLKDHIEYQTEIRRRSIGLDEMVERLEGLATSIVDLERARGRRERLTAAVAQLKKHKFDEGVLDDEIFAAEEQLKTLVCPVCGKAL